MSLICKSAKTERSGSIQSVCCFLAAGGGCWTWPGQTSSESSPVALCESVQSAKASAVQDFSSGCARMWTSRWGGSPLHNAPLFSVPLSLARFCFVFLRHTPFFFFFFIHAHRPKVLSTQLEGQGSLTGCSQQSSSVQPFSETCTRIPSCTSVNVFFHAGSPHKSFPCREMFSFPHLLYHFFKLFYMYV